MFKFILVVYNVFLFVLFVFYFVSQPNGSNKKKNKPLFTSKSPIEVVCEKLWKKFALVIKYKEKIQN